MAYIASAAILTRIREVLEDSAGSLRTVPSGRFAGDLPEGLSLGGEQFRTAQTPRVETSIRRARPSPSTPPVIGNVRIWEIDVEVRVSRLISPLEQVSDDDRVALQAQTLTDADVCAQSLGYPGNLTTTTAGTATDIISGLLAYTGSSSSVLGSIDDGAQTLTTVHAFRGLVISRPALS